MVDRRISVDMITRNRGTQIRTALEYLMASAACYYNMAFHLADHQLLSGDPARRGGDEGSSLGPVHAQSSSGRDRPPVESSGRSLDCSAEHRLTCPSQALVSQALSSSCDQSTVGCAIFRTRLRMTSTNWPRLLPSRPCPPSSQVNSLCGASSRL